MFVVLGVIALGVMLFCGGIGLVVFFAARQIAQPSSGIEQPERVGGFQADADRFNQVLARLSSDPGFKPTTTDPELERFLERSIEDSTAGDEIAFSRDQFIEAVANSKASGGSFGFLDRLTLRTWLDEYPPAPASLDDFTRVIDIRMAPSGNLAEVDLLSYSEESQIDALEWFLAKENDQWRLYDWQRMAFGRRMSDEYASYIKGEPPIDEGYDLAMELLSEAEIAWYEDRREEARRLLLEAEKKPMLAADRSVARLRTAHTWMRLEEYDEAIRVMKTISDPNGMWGVWPSMAVCLWSLDRNEDALEAARNAEKQAPDHPNTRWILSEVLRDLDRDDEAAGYAVKALQVCPHDPTLIRSVVDRLRVEDVPVLVELQAVAGNNEDWASLLDAAIYDEPFAKKLAEEISARDTLPKGLHQLARGALAWANEDHDLAATHFLAAERAAERESLKSLAAENYLSLRMLEDRYDELFSESDDLNATLKSLFLLACEDELYCDEALLLQSLEKRSSDLPIGWATGLKAWAEFMLDQHETAFADFDAFDKWLDANPDSLSEQDRWVIDTTDYYLASLLLRLGRPMEVIQRWPESVARHEQVGTSLLQTGNREQIVAFLKDTQQTPSESVELQRLRLQAAEAFFDGDARRGDELQQQAVELSRSVYSDDQTYWADELLRQRAIDLVWSRLIRQGQTEIAGASEMTPEDRETFMLAAISESVDLRDAEQVQVWAKQAENMGIVSGDSYASIQAQIGEFELARGHSAASAEAFKRAVDHTETDRTWYRQHQVENVMEALLLSKHADRIEQARSWLSTQSSESDGVPLRVTVDLAAGDSETLVSALQQVDPDDVSSWLSQSLTRKLLLPQLDKAWALELLQQHPVTISSVPCAATGELVMGEGGDITLAVVQRLIGEALGERFVAKSIPVKPLEQDDAAWMVTSSTGQRVLVQWSHPKYEIGELPPMLASSLSEPLRRMTICILDDLPSAQERLFQVASRAAGETAILFCWDNQDRKWIGPDLSQKLKWDDRVPVSPSMPIVTLIETLETDDDADFVDLEEWDKRLQDSGGELDIFLTLSAGPVVERLPGVLVGVNSEEYDLLVRPRRDSVLDPLVKNGVVYTTYSSMIEHDGP
ncbi:hypothetical protein Poly41_20680 [Novipirellula artificiosorum]|uniref:Uncharacterized protein n=1 Tax=Novipirellula artificiosorum TaxID=2528016 RepID=A0A5C6DW13_9BACT|nr:hypothetical protein Poly41_20680 [Novipirellula artificiosorum]